MMFRSEIQLIDLNKAYEYVSFDLLILNRLLLHSRARNLYCGILCVVNEVNDLVLSTKMGLIIIETNLAYNNLRASMKYIQRPN